VPTTTEVSNASLGAKMIPIMNPVAARVTTLGDVGGRLLLAITLGEVVVEEVLQEETIAEEADSTEVVVETEAALEETVEETEVALEETVEETEAALEETVQETEAALEETVEETEAVSIVHLAVALIVPPKLHHLQENVPSSSFVVEPALLLLPRQQSWNRRKNQNQRPIRSGMLRLLIPLPSWPSWRLRKMHPRKVCQKKKKRLLKNPPLS
jgi:hypothetical protein